MFCGKDFYLWRNKWENQDEDAKWAVKKDTPAGKYDIK